MPLAPWRNYTKIGTTIRFHYIECHTSKPRISQLNKLIGVKLTNAFKLEVLWRNYSYVNVIFLNAGRCLLSWLVFQKFTLKIAPNWTINIKKFQPSKHHKPLHRWRTEVVITMMNIHFWYLQRPEPVNPFTLKLVSSRIKRAHLSILMKWNPPVSRSWIGCLYEFVNLSRPEINMIPVRGSKRS